MTDTSGQPTTPANSIDVVSLLKKGVENVQSTIASAVSSINGQAGAAAASSTKALAATKEEADAQTQIANVKATRDLQLQADNKGSQAAMGTLPGDASFIAANIRDNVLPKQIQVQKDQDELESMKKVGFFDDPIQHVINSFITPMKEHALAQEEKDINQRLGVSTTIQNLSDSVIAANNATDQVDATAMAKATSQEAFAQAAIKANEIQDRASALGIQATNASLAATTTALDYSFKYTSALYAQDSNNLEHIRTNADLALKDAEIKNNELNLKIHSENEQDKQDAFAAIQKTALEKFGIKIENLQQFKLLGEDQKAILTSAAGSATVTNGIDVISPTRSIDMLRKLGTNGPSPGVAYVTNKLLDMSNPIDTNPAYLTLEPAKKIPLKDQQIETMVNQEAANIPTVNGIYSPLTLDKTANINPVIQSLPLVKEMIAGGMTKDPRTPTNPDDFIATGLNQIRKGTPIKDVAAQIATVFQTVSTNLNDVRRYNLLNIPGLAPDKPYRMSVHTPSNVAGIRGVSSLPKILDMNSFSEVQNYLTRLSAAQRESEATSGLGYDVHQ